MTAPSAAAVPVFDDVLAAQRTFRLLIDALARPGTVHMLPDRLPDVPPDLDPYVALVAFTLLDQEVRFAASGPLAEPFAAYIVRRTGARAAPPDEAAFLFASGDDPASPLAQLPVGSPEFPERGGTAVLAVEGLSAGDGGNGGGDVVLTLSGPGIDGAARVLVRGLTPAVVETFVEQNREYPLGIDAFLVGLDGAVIGLPRTVRIGRDGR
jgi:alpha-D-ribose 1-methylphosphonate 5-triphosphate synthase subunit PhnH